MFIELSDIGDVHAQLYDFAVKVVMLTDGNMKQTQLDVLNVAYAMKRRIQSNDRGFALAPSPIYLERIEREGWELLKQSKARWTAKALVKG